MESIAPSAAAFDFDNVGLQVGAPNHVVTKAVVSLDRSLSVVEHAAARGAQLIVSHHPLFFEPMSQLDTDSHPGATVAALLRNGISLVSAHTNWDVAPGGVSETLALRLGLQAIEPFGDGVAQREAKLVFFCPESAASKVVDALAEAGAGLIGLYRRCAFVQTGTGHFEPLEGAQPTLGSVGSRESVAEARVEMRVSTASRAAVSTALAASHPYEEPAADWYELMPHVPLRLGRMGTLPLPLPLSEFASCVDTALGTRCCVWGDPTRSVQSVAVSGGAADGQWRLAKAAGADVFVTGEVRQHHALEASESGLPIVAAGHYATENPGCGALAMRLRETVPGIEWSHFEPEAGTGGRPLFGTGA